MFCKEVTEIPGVSYSKASSSADNRGIFRKPFRSFDHHQENFKVQEVFYSISEASVIRGMHLQIHPLATSKIVVIQEGNIFDVLLDLRPKSETYLCWTKKWLTPEYISTVYIPEGVAHGFQATDRSLTLYLTSAPYQASLDVGIDSFSFGVDWPMVPAIRSSRDQSLPSLEKWIANCEER